MATVKKIQLKNSETNEIIYPESSSEIVYRSNGETIEASLQKLESEGRIPGPIGPRGPRGEKGADGSMGQNGKTPIKGQDYWTNSDKQEIINEVKASFSNAEGAKF